MLQKLGNHKMFIPRKFEAIQYMINPTIKIGL